jgi:hypothetical protein
MRISSFRFPALIVAAGITLGGCAYNPYGGLGVSVGYGSGYDPYYDRYYSGSRYGYGSSFGYGSYSPYWGWYDDFYYPGTGYYVYDIYRRPHRWTDRQRAYWLQRQQAYRSTDRTSRQLTSNWGDFGRRDRSSGSRVEVRQRPLREQAVRTQQVVREAERSERRQVRQAERSEARAERQQRREDRSGSRSQRREERRADEDKRD